MLYKDSFFSLMFDKLFDVSFYFRADQMYNADDENNKGTTQESEAG